MIWLDCRGKRVSIFASGASLTPEVVDGASAEFSVALNLSFRLAPWADVVYGCDGKFWDEYIDEARETCAGRFLTGDPTAAQRHDLERVVLIPGAGLSTTPGCVNMGGVPGSRSNSGYQAMGLAVACGASALDLYGFDMKGEHWHGPHILALRERLPFDEWLPAFDALAADLRAIGVPVLNHSPDSALRAFPFAHEEVAA